MSRLQPTERVAKQRSTVELSHPFPSLPGAETSPPEASRVCFQIQSRTIGPWAQRASHRNRQQPIWPMRFILNRVLLAFISDTATRVHGMVRHEEQIELSRSSCAEVCPHDILGLFRAHDSPATYPEGPTVRIPFLPPTSPSQ